MDDDVVEKRGFVVILAASLLIRLIGLDFMVDDDDDDDDDDVMRFLSGDLVVDDEATVGVDVDDAVNSS